MARIDLIQLRRGTAALWTSVNPVLGDGEPGFETDTLQFKFGDGVTAWTSLAYVSTGGTTPDASPTVKGKAKLYTGTGTNTDGSMDQNSITTALATEVVNRNAAIAAALVGLVDYRGGYDASVNAYPSSGGSGTAGAILKADFWIVTVAGTLPTGITVAPGDWIFAKIDVPGNTQANWDVVETNLGYTPISVSGAEIYATASGTNIYTATLSPVPVYAAGLTVRLKFTNANTTAATINLNSIGAKSIKKNASVDLAPGDIPAGSVVELIYDGTNFQAIGISDLAAALATKVDETDFVVLTDGATTTWDTTNLQTPLAKWTMGATSRTLAMTNLKSGASGLLVVKTGVSGAITLTFPATSVTDAGPLTVYTFPAGINVFYDLTWWYDSAGGGAIKWLIGVSNIDTDPTMTANSDLLVASQKASKTADDNVLNAAIVYTNTTYQYLPWKNVVDAATVSALPSSTIDGAYQIITSTTNTVFPSIDGYGGGTKFLVMFEADQKKNGKFDLIAPGVAGVSPWQLRRSTDADDTNKLRSAVIRVLNGTVNGGKFFKQDTIVPTIGSANIVFSEFGGGPTDDIDFMTFRNFYGY